MVVEVMIEMVIAVGLIAITSVLFAIVLLTYLRMRTRRMLLITLGFGTFFIEEYNLMITENVMLLLELVGLLFIAIGVLKD